MRNRLCVLFGVFAVMLTSIASAEPIDTTAVVDQIGELETAVMAVGGALISAAAVAVAFKWIKGTIFS